MSETAQLIVALGVAFSSVIAAIFSGIGALQSARNSRKIDEVHRLTNSLSERSNTAERAAGMAEGELKGRDHAAAIAAVPPATPAVTKEP